MKEDVLELVKTPTWNTAEIANFLQLERRYVTDELTKKPDFPKPFTNCSQRNRRWAVADVFKWSQGRE